MHKLPVPGNLTAGDSWRWEHSEVEGFPAADSTLSYVFWNASSFFEVSGASEDGRYVMSLSPAESSILTAGNYQWSAVLTNGVTGEKLTADRGTARIRREVVAEAHDPATSAGYEQTHAERMLLAINAVLENRASQGDLDVIRVGTSGQIAAANVEHDLLALLKMRRLYQREVEQERIVAEREAGKDPGFVGLTFR